MQLTQHLKLNFKYQKLSMPVWYSFQIEIKISPKKKKTTKRQNLYQKLKFDLCSLLKTTEEILRVFMFKKGG